jgi:Fic family protein
MQSAKNSLFMTFYLFIIVSYSYLELAKMPLESVQRIEPARLEDVPEVLSDLIAEISSAATQLESALHPQTAAGLASMVRIMNTYYSNLIEGHNTRPRDIELALAKEQRRIVQAPSTAQIEAAVTNQDAVSPSQSSLLIVARAHVHVQAEIDRLFSTGSHPEPASPDFVLWLHKEFYRNAPEDMKLLRGQSQSYLMETGRWRSRTEHDVAVGRHQPPASSRIPDFMAYFAERYKLVQLGKAARILAIPAAHHRFNYIHPFPDGNGRVSRLMSHAMAHSAGIGAHGLWSVSRGLARGLESRMDYKHMMDHADMPRQGDIDGRGNLSLRALIEFCTWFLKVCLDQIKFMASLFEINTLAKRLRLYVERNDQLKPETARLLEEALVRGSVERGDLSRITGLPERSARRILAASLADGIIASDTPKGSVSLRFPVATQEVLFPRLFLES